MSEIQVRMVSLRTNEGEKTVFKPDFDKGVNESTPIQFIYDQLETLRKHIAELHNRLQQLEGK